MTPLIRENLMATSQKQPAQPEDDGLVVHVHNQTPEEVANFWTFERRNAAKPVPMPEVVVSPPAAGAEQTPQNGKKS
jgi:hypothetical protein